MYIHKKRQNMRDKNRTVKSASIPPKRKYLNFYEKVTEFLMESYRISISKWRSYKKRIIFFLQNLIFLWLVSLNI